ncbi:MAG: hypothetical protein CM15mP93_14750 [Thiotrichaceae bacterium]|nr:MAG: hypothetical protein CM15mP93_14750 [Thiotrichaceae bacterium]
MLYLKYFALSFTFFIIIDLLWLGFIASNIYKHFLSDFWLVMLTGLPLYFSI